MVATKSIDQRQACPIVARVKNINYEKIIRETLQNVACRQPRLGM